MAAGPDEIELSEDELRAITGFAADCAREVLALFERSHPADQRPREALDAAYAFAGGGRRTAALRRCAWAAYRAGREAADPPAAGDAALAASHAAAAAYLHPRASAHQVKHLLGAAAHAARARELALTEPRAGAGSAEQADRTGDSASADGGCAAADTLAWARRHAPGAVVAVLGRLPAAPPGGGRVGQLVRDLDAALRG
ncbi:putative immunity protein [Streptomyces sp. NPDC005573]|uniref:putative immunity protein n=1 Tax=Streptomyces sp. NPDC005573 TaxID=3156890 RepID=UPI0033B77C63